MAGYNEAKKEILQIISLSDMNAWDIALITNRSQENASTLLRNYHLMGLLSRSKIGRGYTYSLTARGTERLLWLQSMEY